MQKEDYQKNVFINCPFDDEYLLLFHSIVFSVYDCGYIARCALEAADGSVVRIEKIYNLIQECKFGIHDLSQVGLDVHTSLPRFNMPLELGLFLGAKRFGNKLHKGKTCLILDSEKYRYRGSTSDISGQDIAAHNNDIRKVVSIVRDWLKASTNERIPGGDKIFSRYNLFMQTLPTLCDELELDKDRLPFNDYVELVSHWLTR